MIRPMTASAARSVVGSEYTLGEEIANSITSGIASALSVAALAGCGPGDGFLIAIQDVCK